jgi:hypothetical protein
VASFVRIASRTVRLLVQQSQRAGQLGGAPVAPPSTRVDRALSLAAYWGFNAALVISALLLFGFLALGSRAVWLAWLRVVLGAAMAVEGFLLARNWRGARRLVLWRIERRREARGGGRSVSTVLLRRLGSPALELIGIVWVAAGTLAAALGAERLL